MFVQGLCRAQHIHLIGLALIVSNMHHFVDVYSKHLLASTSPLLFCGVKIGVHPPPHTAAMHTTHSTCTFARPSV